MKIKGLKKAVSETKCVPSGYHVQIDYDVETEELVVSDILTTNSYIVRDGRKVIHVCDAYRAMTMVELQEEVKKAIILKMGFWEGR